MTNEEFRIKQFQAGDKQAFSSLYDDYSGALYGIILRICKDEGHAQDLLQETFVKIWKKAPTYDPNKGRFYTWAYRIARNLTLNAMRSKNKLIQTEEIGVYIKTAATDDDDQNFDLAIKTMAMLDEHHQKALELVYFNGLTHREAHKEMDVPLGTFKSYIQQALKKLRTAYQVSIIILVYLMMT